MYYFPLPSDFFCLALLFPDLPVSLHFSRKPMRFSPASSWSWSVVLDMAGDVLVPEVSFRCLDFSLMRSWSCLAFCYPFLTSNPSVLVRLEDGEPLSSPAASGGLGSRLG